MTLIDITAPLERNLPLWPGDVAPRLSGERDSEGYLTSTLTSSLHAGTHLDAPRHLLEDGGDVAGISPETLFGECRIVEILSEGPIRAEELKALKLTTGLQRLLLKTRRSPLLDIESPWACLAPDAADLLCELEVALVGIDTVSIGAADETGHRVHERLLRVGVVIVEGLRLEAVDPGEYELICLPLRIPGADGSPVRALLRE